MQSPIPTYIGVLRLLNAFIQPSNNATLVLYSLLR
jgi:hypothetical protein